MNKIPEPLYESMSGIDARIKLNDLGYLVDGDEEKDRGLVSLIVSLAVQVDHLTKAVNELQDQLSSRAPDS